MMCWKWGQVVMKSVQEAGAEAKLWMATGLKYDMVYCWILNFNEDRKITRVRAYLDTDLLTRAIAENK